MSNVIILGSTGSLGRQTLEVLKKYKKYFKIIGLSANTNKNLLYSQAKTFKVPDKNIILSSLFSASDSEKALIKLAKNSQAEIIVNVLSGLAGVKPTIAALKARKIILLGNKESLVAEGEKIMELAKKWRRNFPPNSCSAPSSRNSCTLHNPYYPSSSHLPPPNLIPLDSEHNAIFEILKKFPNKKIKKITLPCSGGPFLNKTKSQIAKITPSQALNHPVWKMGKKILIESAALINKGFEIIEAHYLFNLPLNKIKVKIHPQGKIHGIVEFESARADFYHTKSFSAGQSYFQQKRPDQKTVHIAYFSKPDMREHIENALLHALPIKLNKICTKTYPHARTNRKIRPLKPNEIPAKNPPHKTLPGIKIVLKAFKTAKNDPQKMTKFLKKEETTINKFLKGKIPFPKIFREISV